MRSFVWLSIVLAGCAARYRTEHVGVAQVSASAGAGSIDLGRGDYQMAMRFEVPRAQVVTWTLNCPGVERTGVAGETAENYRTRRLADLQRMVEQDRRGLATVTNVIAGPAAARVQVRAPGASVQAEATAPSGEVVAENAIEQIHELPYGDVGAGSYIANIRVQTFEDGACTVATQSLDPVGGSLVVDRVRDLRAEEQERVIAQRANAIDARGRMRARLVAFGADEQLRDRRLAEQARQRAQEAGRRAELEARQADERRERAEANRLRLEAEARIRWETEAPERARRARLEEDRQARIATEQQAEASRLLVIEEERRARLMIIEKERRMRLVIIERERTRAFTVRGEYIAWLVGQCHADPHRRARLEMERTERSRRIDLEIEVRTRRIETERIERMRRIEIEAELVARQEREREQRQLQGAFAVRTQLSGYLVNAGARMRPPRPAARVEIAGIAPFEGARWDAGTWFWIQGAWQWRTGGWVDSVQFGAAGGETYVRTPGPVEREVVTTTTSTSSSSSSSSASVEVAVPAGITISVPAVQGSISVTPARRATPAVRDHRRRDTRTEEPRVRDHRRR